MVDITAIADECFNQGDEIYFLDCNGAPSKRKIIRVEISQAEKYYTIKYRVKDVFPDENHPLIDGNRAFLNKSQLIDYLADIINNLDN